MIVVSFLMISKNIIYPSLLSLSSSLGIHEYSPCLHEFFTVSTEIFFTYNPQCFTICPFGLTLKMSTGVSILPEAVTVKVHVAHFVSDVYLRIWTVQILTISRVDLAL